MPGQDRPAERMKANKMKTKKGYTQDGDTLTRDDGNAEAVRYYKRDGANFTGWIVRSTTDRFSYSDAIPTKDRAIAALLKWDK